MTSPQGNLLISANINSLWENINCWLLTFSLLNRTITFCMYSQKLSSVTTKLAFPELVAAGTSRTRLKWLNYFYCSNKVPIIKQFSYCQIQLSIYSITVSGFKSQSLFFLLLCGNAFPSFLTWKALALCFEKILPGLRLFIPALST